MPQEINRALNNKYKEVNERYGFASADPSSSVVPSTTLLMTNS